ncbi:MAG TPA: flagellar transcriptional regulator FlhD [Ramlibacter sp.]
MTGAEVSKEISDLNLTYMLLAQKLLRQDRAAAMFRLGITRELADMLAAMSLSQVVRLAATNFVLCGFRLDDVPSVATMVQETRDQSLQQAHLSILLAARQNDQQAQAA